MEKFPSVLGAYFISRNIPSRKEAGYYIHSNVCNARWVRHSPNKDASKVKITPSLSLLRGTADYAIPTTLEEYMDYAIPTTLKEYEDYAIPTTLKEYAYKPFHPVPALPFATHCDLPLCRLTTSLALCFLGKDGKSRHSRNARPYSASTLSHTTPLTLWMHLPHLYALPCKRMS